MQKEKKESDKDLIFGIHPVREAIEAHKEFDRILIPHGTISETLKELITLAKAQNIPVHRVPSEKFERLTRRNKNHQHVIAFMSAVRYAPLEEVIAMAYEKGEAPFILVLDRVTDVRNFGAIVRTAECAGVHGIVVPSKNAAQIGSDALRTSAGALLHVPICRSQPLWDALIYMKEAGLQILCTTEKTDNSIYEPELFDAKAPLALVLGSEENGIANENLQHADVRMALPLQGQIASLNVSVAAGIAMYEVRRRRNIE
ncbi:MAG: 23S rRNA (guanosine(2251)-2'-O)-methyltransferase RlmB [Bernardetiaceae bacterium]|nr:23S rRNA (guanosine(2251)-2'-O)-methyltransferase RlmB [Bernardetiaceae bacterium]